MKHSHLLVHSVQGTVSVVVAEGLKFDTETLFVVTKDNCDFTLTACEDAQIGDEMALIDIAEGDTIMKSVPIRARSAAWDEHIALDVQRHTAPRADLGQNRRSLIDNRVNSTASGRLTVAEALGQHEFVLTRLPYCLNRMHD